MSYLEMDRPWLSDEQKAKIAAREEKRRIERAAKQPSLSEDQEVALLKMAASLCGYDGLDSSYPKDYLIDAEKSPFYQDAAGNLRLKTTGRLVEAAED